VKKLPSIFSDNQAVILVFIGILAVYGLSFYKSRASYTYWMENSSQYVVEDVTAMSTLDAYWWLKLARDLDEGRLGKEIGDPVKEYPDLNNYPDTANLLARLISLGKNFTGGDYYRAGLLLIPFLAGLFVFPLFLYFKTLGFGAAAVLGGLIGSFSLAYFQRTMMGRVDTDLLNTFFPIAVSAFIVLISKERVFRINMLCATGAGLTMYLYNWWYQQPGFIMVYLFFMTFYLLLNRITVKQIAWLLLVFLVASGPLYMIQSIDSIFDFVRAYIAPLPTGQIFWPDSMTGTSESLDSNIVEKLRTLHGFLPVVFSGFIGLIYLYIIRFRQMIPITPIILLGVWSLAGPKRFTMYLAPFIGIGTGVLLELIINYAGQKLRLRPVFVSLASVSLMFILFFSTSVYTGYARNSAPIIPAATTKAFLDIKRIVPRHSAMLTWWDYGYPLMQIGEFATYHDGSAHGSIRTTLLAMALTSSEQEDIVSLLAYAEEYGFLHLQALILEDNISAEELMGLAFEYKGDMRGENVYILYLDQMIWQFNSISAFGTWDFAQRKSDPIKYRKATCFSLVDNVLHCKGGKFDLNRGIISNGRVESPLKGVLFVNDGYVVSGKDFASGEGDYLQILMKNNKMVNVLVVGDRLFRTNFNQQYLLGNYDRRYFEEVYNNFPVARVLKVKRVNDVE